MSFSSFSNPLTKAMLRENFTLFTEEFKLLKRFRQDSVENWNLSNSFISYGRKSEIQTLVNTIMVESVLHEENMMFRMKPEDLNALTPLFTVNINPYGYFLLDFEKPSMLLEAA